MEIMNKHCQNGSAFLFGDTMKSRQQWTINGDVITCSGIGKHHIKFYVKGKLSTPTYSTKIKIDCVVPIRLYDNLDTTKPFRAVGHIEFNKSGSYFFVEQL